MSDVLYEFEWQYREKRAIWRMLELAPIRYELAGGRIWKWIGINIPFSLIGCDGDIDLLLSLRDIPADGFRVRRSLSLTWD